MRLALSKVLASWSARIATATVVIALMGLWIRSYWVTDTLAWSSPGTGGILRSSRGRILLNLATLTGAPPPMFEPVWTFYSESRTKTLSPWWHDSEGTTIGGLGFYAAHERAGTLPSAKFVITSRFVICPTWFPLAISAGILALQIRQADKLKRASRGLCPTCGYDLRETPTRCPECGTEVPPVKDTTNPA